MPRWRTWWRSLPSASLKLTGVFVFTFTLKWLFRNSPHGDLGYYTFNSFFYLFFFWHGKDGKPAEFGVELMMWSGVRSEGGRRQLQITANIG